MRWEGREESKNIEDRRGIRPSTALVGGGIGTIILVVLGLVFGADIRKLLEQGGGGAPTQTVPVDPAEEPLKKFIGVVVKDTEDVWRDQFPRNFGKQYRDAKVVLYSERVQSGCGLADARMGPFYCPKDETVYLDLKFFGELQSRFGAKGDFAIAYVVAHEVGHHVQKQLGYTDYVHGQPQNNELSIRLELQADYLAGVWARRIHEKKVVLEPGDVEEAMRAAEAVGDDRLQIQAQGYANPDSFTHGDAKQRAFWFTKGVQTGDASKETLDEFFTTPWERFGQFHLRR